MHRRILVTGARRGIGAAIAVGLAGADRTLLLHHLAAPDEAERVARECRGRGALAETLEADLTDPAAVRELAERAGAVDILSTTRRDPPTWTLGGCRWPIGRRRSRST